VGIDFGIGRYQPHTATEVLANNMATAKDKDTCSGPAAGEKVSIPAPALSAWGFAHRGVPSPAGLHHVITTIEQSRRTHLVDSTPEVAPYRLLSAPIRDQLALVVPAQGRRAWSAPLPRLRILCMRGLS